MFCHKVQLSEKITGERNSYERELRGQKEGLGVGSELLECVTGWIWTYKNPPSRGGWGFKHMTSHLKFKCIKKEPRTKLYHFLLIFTYSNFFQMTQINILFCKCKFTSASGISDCPTGQFSCRNICNSYSANICNTCILPIRLLLSTLYSRCYGSDVTFIVLINRNNIPLSVKVVSCNSTCSNLSICATKICGIRCLSSLLQLAREDRNRNCNKDAR